MLHNEHNMTITTISLQIGILVLPWAYQIVLCYFPYASNYKTIRICWKHYTVYISKTLTKQYFQNKRCLNWGNITCFPRAQVLKVCTPMAIDINPNYIQTGSAEITFVGSRLQAISISLFPHTQLFDKW